MPAHACASSPPGTPKTHLPTNYAINTHDHVCPPPGTQRPAAPGQSSWEQVRPAKHMPCHPLRATTALDVSLPAQGADDEKRALPVLLGKLLAFMHACIHSFVHSFVLRIFTEHLVPARLSPDAGAASTHGGALPHGARLPGTWNQSPSSHLGSIADQLWDLGSVSGPL